MNIVKIALGFSLLINLFMMLLRKNFKLKNQLSLFSFRFAKVWY